MGSIHFNSSWGRFYIHYLLRGKKELVWTLGEGVRFKIGIKKVEDGNI